MDGPLHNSQVQPQCCREEMHMWRKGLFRDCRSPAFYIKLIGTSRNAGSISRTRSTLKALISTSLPTSTLACVASIISTFVLMTCHIRCLSQLKLSLGGWRACTLRTNAAVANATKCLIPWSIKSKGAEKTSLLEVQKLYKVRATLHEESNAISIVVCKSIERFV